MNENAIKNDDVVSISKFRRCNFQFNDGGREHAGFKGFTGDCVVRSIAIATGLPYKKIYNDINNLAKLEHPKYRKKRSSSRTGVHRVTYERYIESLGWHWHPLTFVGVGCNHRLNIDDLPKGRLIVRLSGHLTAVINHTIYDIYNPDRGGWRWVYGYYSLWFRL